MDFKTGQKVWTPEKGWARFERQLVCTPEFSYVKQGGAFWRVMSDTISANAPYKPTKEEKYLAHAQRIRIAPDAYAFAGWIAVQNGLLHVSTPPKYLDKVRDILDAHAVDYDDSTLTISSDRTVGWSISVVVARPPFNLDAAGIHATDYFTSGKVSTQTRQFCLEFLLDDLKFRLGHEQNLSNIRSRVPQQFLPDFEKGVSLGSR